MKPRSGKGTSNDAFYPLVAVIGVALTFSACATDTAAPAQSTNTTQLPGVQVTASAPSVQFNVPSTTTVITRQQMDCHLVTTIRDLVQYEPGVSAISSAGRFGRLGSFNIRGLSGNRTRPNPLTYDLNSFLAKYAHTATSGRVHRVIVDGSQMHTDTDGLSQLVPSYGVTPTYYHSQDENTCVRASVGQWFPQLRSVLADTPDWNAYWQKSVTHTNTQTD